MEPVDPGGLALAAAGRRCGRVGGSWAGRYRSQGAAGCAPATSAADRPGAVASGNAGSPGGPTRAAGGRLTGAPAGTVPGHATAIASGAGMCGPGYLAQRRGGQSAAEPAVLPATG